MVRRPDTVVDGPYVCDNGPFLSSPVGRSTRPIARSTARIPPLACARSFVADRDSSSVPPLDPHATPRPLVRRARDRRAVGARARRITRARGVVGASRSIRCDARERGKGDGAWARVFARRVASRRVRRRRARAMDDYSRARGWMTSRDARGDRPRAMGRWWTRANARGGRGAVDAVEGK